MAEFVKGDVVVVPFPFSNLSDSKRRPALVLSRLEGDDLILCQITSQQIRDRYAISLGERDFASGSLKQASNVRPNRIFTADQLWFSTASVASHPQGSEKSSSVS